MIKPYEAKSLTAIDGVAHGFFSREGGLSQGIYSSLNCGLGSGDDQALVQQNRERVAAQLGTSSQRLISLYQVHSPLAVRAEEPWPRPQAPKADAMVTNKPGLALGVLTADCAPVLFADAHARIVGAAHAGWRGALGGVLEATIAEMETLGSVRAGIHAAIGPAISAKAYEVGDEFQQTFLEADADYGAYFAVPDGGGRPFFNLSGFVYDRLTATGIGHIEKLGLCTYAPENRLFSYRRSVHQGESDYGRQISAILLA